MRCRWMVGRRVGLVNVLRMGSKGITMPRVICPKWSTSPKLHSTILMWMRGHRRKTRRGSCTVGMKGGARERGRKPMCGVSTCILLLDKFNLHLVVIIVVSWETGGG